MAADDPQFAYMNARVRSLKSMLFPRARIEEFLHQNDLARMTEAMLDSPYRQQLAEALSHGTGADAIEDAVTRNVALTSSMLLARATGRPLKLLKHFLMRWDLRAVKSLVRARHHGLGPDDAVASLVPGALMTPGVLRRLAECPNMETLCGQLIAWNPDLCGGLSSALAAYKQSGEVAVLDEALDQRYFVRATEQLRRADDESGQLLHFFMRLERDRINLRLIFLRLREPGAPPIPAARFLPEGTLSLPMLARLGQAQDAAEVVRELSGKRYGEFVTELYQFTQTQRFSPIERLFERVLLRELRRLSVRDPLSFAVVMDYACRKYNEAVNLRLIARGMAGHVPPGRVREQLVFI